MIIKQIQKFRRPGRTRPGSARVGYTLIEMLIVMTVIGILATMAIPSQVSGSAVSLKSAGRVLASDLRLATDLAVQYSTDYQVLFDVGRNEYRLVHTGTGSPPALYNPYSATGSTGSYTVSISPIDGTTGDLNGVRLLGVKLKTTGTTVNNITFGASGGTGPVRMEDTEVWLIQGPAWNGQYLRLTVSAVTGQVWMDQPAAYPAP